MVYSEFGGDHYNAQPSTPFTPSIPPKRITTTELPIVDPDPGERPFLLSDDATTPTPPQSFESAFPPAYKEPTTPSPSFSDPYLGFRDPAYSPTPPVYSPDNTALSGQTATHVNNAPTPSTPSPSTLSAIDTVQNVPTAKAVPQSGWRKFIYKASRGTINPGLSTEEKEVEALKERVRQNVRGDYRIACLSLKGGVGKTTTTVELGSTFASLRGDRIIAIDANPDLGTLAQRVPQQTNSTVRDLLEDPSIHRYSDVQAHTSQALSRLEVLASEFDPAISEAFSEKDYRRTIDILQSFYNIILTDCGTGLMHDAMHGVLDLADSLVLVSSPAIDGARSAWSTLNWLDAHGYQHLVKRTVVAICSSRAGSASIDMDQLQATFNQRCAAVHLIPFDEHLAEGSEVDMDKMGKATRRAFIELAASVADGFSQTLVPTSVKRPEKHHVE